MASSLRIIGPEFENPKSRIGFVEIADAVRQFSTHAREVALMIRSPFTLPHDHFVLVWSRGAAFVTLYGVGGRIIGDADTDWISTTEAAGRDGQTVIESPIAGLIEGVAHLKLLLLDSLDPRPVLLNKAVRGIAQFVDEAVALNIRLGADRDSFTAATTSELTRRTIYHQPYILRVTDSGTALFAPSDIQLIANRFTEVGIRSLVPTTNSKRSSGKGRGRASLPRRKSKVVDWILVALGAGILVLFLSLPKEVDRTTTLSDTLKVTEKPQKAVPPTRLVLNLRTPAQLFVSPRKFTTRSQLDDAIANGQGFRSLPSRHHEVTLDSLQFAKGVYGYFKTDNKWRNGMLLQSFQMSDTFQIDNFLSPLP